MDNYTQGASFYIEMMFFVLRSFFVPNLSKVLSFLGVKQGASLEISLIFELFAQTNCKTGFLGLIVIFLSALPGTLIMKSLRSC